MGGGGNGFAALVTAVSSIMSIIGPLRYIWGGAKPERARLESQQPCCSRQHCGQELGGEIGTSADRAKGSKNEAEPTCRSLRYHLDQLSFYHVLTILV